MLMKTISFKIKDTETFRITNAEMAKTEYFRNLPFNSIHLDIDLYLNKEKIKPEDPRYKPVEYLDILSASKFEKPRYLPDGGQQYAHTSDSCRNVILDYELSSIKVVIGDDDADTYIFFWIELELTTTVSDWISLNITQNNNILYTKPSFHRISYFGFFKKSNGYTQFNIFEGIIQDKDELWIRHFGEHIYFPEYDDR